MPVGYFAEINEGYVLCNSGSSTRYSTATIGDVGFNAASCSCTGPTYTAEAKIPFFGDLTCNPVDQSTGGPVFGDYDSTVWERLDLPHQKL